MTAKSAVDVSLIITLPLTISTNAETIDIANFTIDGTGIEYGFVDTNRVEFKLGADGTGEAFKNLNNLRYVEFTIVPLSEIDKKLIKFTNANSGEALIIQIKDNNTGVGFFSEKAFFKTVNPVIVSSNPDFKTYRIEMLDALEI